MPEITANGININYQEQGEGEALVLLHGLSDDCNLWAPMMPVFSGRFRTIALDIRGHGQSGKPDEPYSIKQFSDDLLALMDGLKINRAHVAGLSLGSAIAMQFALDHPFRIDALVLLSTFAFADDHVRNRMGMLRNSLENGGVQAFFDVAVRLVVSDEFITVYADALADAKQYTVAMNSAGALTRAIDACLKFDVRNRLSGLSAPLLILSGKEDVFTRTVRAEEVHDAVRGSQLIIMPGVGHNLLTPENMPVVERKIMEFLG